MEFKINIADTYMNVIKFGQGKRILTIIAGASLCGLEGMGQALETSLSTFSNDFTVYVFDRIKVIPKDYSIERMAEDVYFCLKSLGVTSTSVYGASQGGMIGQILTLTHPEMVDHLVVCSSMCRTTPTSSKVIDLWIEAAKTADVRKVNQLFLDYVYSEAFVDSIKDSIPALLNNGTPSDCERFVNMLEPIHSFNIYDSLKNIKCPVLVLGDENDKVIGPEGSKEIANTLNCDIYMYNQYSHAVYDEAPDLKERIKEFIL